LHKQGSRLFIYFGENLMYFRKLFAMAVLALVMPGAVLAAPPDTSSDPGADKHNDQERLHALEERVKQLESAPPAPSPASSVNSFNPAISLILSGIYTNLSQDPANYHITGFPVPSDVEIDRASADSASPRASLPSPPTLTRISTAC
jgi:hypothetical protein